MRANLIARSVRMRLRVIIEKNVMTVNPSELIKTTVTTRMITFL